MQPPHGSLISVVYTKTVIVVTISGCIVRLVIIILALGIKIDHIEPDRFINAVNLIGVMIGSVPPREGAAEERGLPSSLLLGLL